MNRVRIGEALRGMAQSEPVSVRIKGNCMSPLVTDGQHVTLESRSLYIPGDVIGMCMPDGQLTLHRCIGYSVDSRGVRLLTQADNATAPDPAVPLSRVIGKLAGHRPRATERTNAAFKCARAYGMKVRKFISP